MELKFKVKNQIMTLKTNAQLVDGSMNYLKLSFMFSEDWTGLAKQIIFFYEDKNSTYDIVDDAIIVPEYYTAHDYFNFTVVGREQDTLRITTNLTTVTLLESGYMGTGDEPAPPEDVYTAIMQKLMDITNNITTNNMKIPCIDVGNQESATVYSSDGINCQDQNGFTISTYYGKYLKFDSYAPEKITTNFGVLKYEGHYSDTQGNSYEGHITLYDNGMTRPTDDLALWYSQNDLKNMTVIQALVDTRGMARTVKTDIDSVNSAKQDKSDIISTITGGAVTLTANTEYHHIKEDSSTLTFTLPTTIEEDYQSYISFKSGATATTITISTFDGTLKFKGDDCANGIFTPAANTVYEVALKCIGMDSNNKPYIVARVGAC